MLANLSASDPCPINQENQQLLLDFESTIYEQNYCENDHSLALNKLDVRRSAIAWLVAQNATGVGIDVPTRFKRFKADLGAFWNSQGRNVSGQTPNKVYIPNKTVVMVCRHSRRECWPEFTQSNQLLSKLKQLKEERDDFEKRLRESEPQLRDSATLFEEFTHWNYEKSQDKSYHELRKKVELAEKAIYKGSLFERIFNAKIADRHYLVVPTGTIHKNELAAGWGLLWVDDNYNVVEKLEAKDCDCSIQNRYHLIQNIASANLCNVLFSSGIAQNNGEYQFTRLPRRRRPNSESITVTY